MRSIVRAAIALLGGIITSFVTGQLFVWLYLERLSDLARRNALMVYDATSPGATDSWQVNRLHSRGWWIFSLIGFVAGFFPAWNYTFRLKKQK